MNKKEPEPQSEPPYRTLDTSLFEGRFKYFSRDLEPVQVRGKIHTLEEQFYLHPADLHIEPIENRRGTRTYVHMKPFVLVPDIVLTIGVYPQPDEAGAIGEVIKSQERKHKEVEIGQAQAWYYPQDRTIMLWECLLNPFVQDKPLFEDPNMRDLWYSFERFLRKNCTGADRIVTPYHDPEYEHEEYQEFLASLAYTPHPAGAKAAWSKPIELA